MFIQTTYSLFEEDYNLVMTVTVLLCDFVGQTQMRPDDPYTYVNKIPDELITKKE
jgi:hypothetical protein